MGEESEGWREWEGRTRMRDGEVVGEKESEGWGSRRGE